MIPFWEMTCFGCCNVFTGTGTFFPTAAVFSSATANVVVHTSTASVASRHRDSHDCVFQLIINIMSPLALFNHP
jgi:hypothetical protein